MKTVWRIYLRETEGVPGREFGIDFPTLEEAKRAKESYGRWWSIGRPNLKYYIRAVKVPT